MLPDGLYEQIINIMLNDELERLKDKYIQRAPIDEAEAPKILAKYIAEVAERELERVKGGKKAQAAFVNKIISAIKDAVRQDDIDRLSIAEEPEQLLALTDKMNPVWAARAVSGKGSAPVRPETSIAQSGLFTGDAVHEPKMYSEFKKEILSCSNIDMLVSFIRGGGLRLIKDELTAFTQNGGRLRIITTSYMGATEARAVEELEKLPNTQIKISYDTQRTRLHAKAYIFHRDTGFTTAYIGSSNLSNAAISDGLEWNVKATQRDLPEIIGKITATFESYWNDGEFELYSKAQHERLVRALQTEHKSCGSEAIFTADISPYSYQREILDRLEAERIVRGYTRNLIVAATGTGKTVISALDYKRFRRSHPKNPCRLLFVAHREEILKQSLYTFRAVLKDANFGEIFTGSCHPDSFDNLFISIQTFNSQSFTERTKPDFYSFIIIDEFHHAAAPTYQRLLEYYRPDILLGLTATPERMDGKNIFKYFSGRVAAEIRLPEAINRQLLCPFHYFGVTDTVDLSRLKWSRGGYDKVELSNIYTLSGAAASKRADMIISSLQKYLTDIDTVKGLGFCVSIKHAEFMCSHFNRCGIPSLFITGSSPDEERKTAKERLISGEVRFIFAVDIYNEGVDIPEINTVLFLRPTESLTVFLQQLGRGLRLSEGKECLTVLDFIGQANSKYCFENKFAALLSNTAGSVKQEIRNGFNSAPKGCYIQLEKIAAKYILENIEASYGKRKELIERLASFYEDTGMYPTLADFLSHYRMDPRSLYKKSASTRLSFSRLCAEANIITDFSEPLEAALTKALARLSSVDSRRWIAFLLKLLSKPEAADISSMSEAEQRMLRMFYITVWPDKENDLLSLDIMRKNLRSLADNPVMLYELKELLKYKYDRIDFIDSPIDLGFDCPLDLHCSYTQNQILTALDYLKPSAVREGVKWLPEHKLDILFVTLNKADKDYSPTTMYKDYSVSERLFHWQSQSTTAEHSNTGRRYINHKKQGSHVLLFVREFKSDKISGDTAAYTYLGTANYREHCGEKPMNIIWELDYPIPAKYINKTNKLLAG